MSARTQIREPSYFIRPNLFINCCSIIQVTVPYNYNVIVKEIVFTQKKKPAALIYGMAGFFIMLLRSRNQRKSFRKSLEPIGSEIFLAQRA